MTYHRPKTRGELKRKLIEGITCEVVASNVSTTNTLLYCLGLNPEDYSNKPSENTGWALYIPSPTIKEDVERD